MRDLIERVDRLAELVSELKQKLRDGSQPDGGYIDWAKMPTDTLVVDDNGYIRHLALVDRGGVYVFPNGATSLTHDKIAALVRVNNPKLAKGQSWSPWFGGSCPIDPGVAVNFVLRGEKYKRRTGPVPAGDLRWELGEKYQDLDIVAWRISDEQETVK